MKNLSDWNLQPGDRIVHDRMPNTWWLVFATSPYSIYVMHIAPCHRGKSLWGKIAELGQDSPQFGGCSVARWKKQ